MSENPVFFSERPSGHPQGLCIHGIVFSAPARWLVLDIETGDAPDDAIATAVENWKPPANIKDTTKIEARRAEAAQKRAKRAALLDASPILCVAVKSNHWAGVFSGIGGAEIKGCNVLASNSEADMLKALRVFLDRDTAPETVVVGHNIRAFDLAKLRNAYLRHRLKLPAILTPRILDGEQVAAVVDTALLFKAFSMEHRDDFCQSLDVVATSLGIPRPKGIISGADVPRLHKAGEHAAILTYCAVDTECTARAFLLMTGPAEDLK